MTRSFNTLAMIYAVVVLVSAATWVVPGGEYTLTVQNGRTLVVAGSYHEVPSQPQGVCGPTNTIAIRNTPTMMRKMRSNPPTLVANMVLLLLHAIMRTNAPVVH